MHAAGEQTKAAVLILNNSQGFPIGEHFFDCLDDGQSETSPFDQHTFFRVPAEVLNGIAWTLYYPLLAEHYDDVYVVLGGAPDELVAKLREATKSHERVDMFTMAHTNTFGGTGLANIPVTRFRDDLSLQARRRLGLFYSMGCEDGNDVSAASAHEIGFQTYVGHVGTAPNFLFTGQFLEQWVGRTISVEEATRAAYAATQARIKTLSERFYCVVDTKREDVEEAIAPFTSGVNVSFRSEHKVAHEQPMKKLLDDLLNGKLREDPTTFAHDGQLEPVLKKEEGAKKGFPIYRREQNTVALFAEMGGRKLLESVIIDPRTSLTTALTAVDLSREQKNSTAFLVTIVRNTSLRIQIRKAAVIALFEKGATRALTRLLEDRHMDPEVIHAICRKSLRGEFYGPINDFVPYTFTQTTLLPSIRNIARRRNLPQLVTEQAQCVVDYFSSSAEEH